MTDKEIKKELEWCQIAANHIGSATLSKEQISAIFDLINRRDAEIERLWELIKEIYGLNGELEEVDKKLKNIYEIEDSLRAEKADVMYYKDQIKSEARKEVVNMVKQRMYKNVSAPTPGQRYVMKKFTELLDNLLKEMEDK